jgi:hypothetical protein
MFHIFLCENWIKIKEQLFRFSSEGIKIVIFRVAFIISVTVSALVNV